MKKWAGFFLSDHTMQINKDEQRRKQVFTKKSEMDAAQIGALLLKAYSENYRVSVQLKDLDDDGQYGADVVGLVKGYTGDDQIIVGGKQINLEDINHVEIIK